jgi:hypothetical protein
LLDFPEDINEPSFELRQRAEREKYDQTMRAIRSYFDLCFEEWDLHQKGLIDPEFWATWEAGMKTAMSKASFKQAWEIVKQDSVFGPRFEAFFDNLRT